MSARPLEPHAGQLTIVGLDRRLAAPWLRQAHRAHAVVYKLSRRLDAGETDVACDLRRALSWRSACVHHALAYGARPDDLPAGEP